jgi:hypothetical protein
MIKPPRLLRRALDRFGGYSALARVFGMPNPSTVHGWARSQRLPALARYALQALLKKSPAMS